MNQEIGRLRRIGVAMVLVVGLISGRALADCTCINKDCYEDVIVSGAGTTQVNGTHVFDGMLNGKPRYVIGILAEIYYSAGKWIVTSGAHGYEQVSSAATPPATGWQTAGGAAPAPTLSEGKACSSRTAPLEILPLGAGGEGSILDRVPATTQGDQVGIESFRLLDLDGSVTCVSPLHLCIYETDYSANPPTRTLIDYRFVPCDSVTGGYEFDIPLYALLSPIHDVVLAFADEPVLDTYGLPSTGSASLGTSAGDGSDPMAVYQVGETITGRCRILIDGIPNVTSYIHLYIYALDLSARPVTSALLDHWVVRCGSGTSIYSLEIPTDELAAGDYSIHLVFEDGSTQNIPIHLAEPTT